MANRIPRRAYAGMYGPTLGDKIRLADTELFIEVEKDFTAQPPTAKAGQGGYSANTPLYGEEVKFGGGKVIRDGMGQSQITNAAGAVDTVITNALILDHWGIVRPISASGMAASRPSARPAIPISSRASTS